MHRLLITGLGALSLAFTLPAAADTANNEVEFSTTPCTITAAVSKPILTKLNDASPEFKSAIGKDVQIVKPMNDKGEITLKVPIAADKMTTIVPGDKGAGELYVCNNGSTQKARLSIAFTNAETAGDVKDTSDRLYDDLLVNGKPFKDYAGKTTVLVNDIVIDNHAMVKVPVNYELPFKSTSGNKAGEKAKTVDGKANDYKHGSRTASMNVTVKLTGIDDPVPPERKLALTGAVASTAALVGAAGIAAGVIIRKRSNKSSTKS